ncbi:carbohydrate kinase family protein [Cesiribacter andamanensis]|uniref:Putative sugar kinase ydjH n=1 Tax=Cesiribacter andamanensis AMV16 TaxID=1279009 RepID=M7NBN8_9BACT|nr:carbohydrate kinase [Cesiribacter andamanensis]EMR04667.1 putative sugar kinase ydjH [Cesiribacter andamanensis AMV16]
MSVLSFGEILFDIIEGEHYLGGAPLNFAAHLAQLGEESYIFSRLGQDELGKRALEQISAFGVHTDYVQLDETHPTGTVPVEVRDGQPSYTILEGVAYDYIQFREQSFAGTAFDVLYFGTLAQRNSVSREALAQLMEHQTFKEVFYDINLRKNSYTPQVIRQSLERCTILKLNDDEVSVLASMFYGQEMSIEAFARQLAKEYSIRLIIVTAGAKGCYLYEQEELSFVKGYPAKVVDTVGAGDSFSAAFLSFYLKTADALQAADLANQVGAFVASSRGPLPTYSAEIKKVLMIG